MKVAPSIRIAALGGVLLALAPQLTSAQSNASQAMQPPTQGAHSMGPASGAATPMAFVDGEVRKVDRAQRKLTLRHGPIPHLQMEAMTMVFRVSDPAMLDGLQTGDPVRFSADKLNGMLTVTGIEVVR